jgi:SAM-dependent methyltransferase
MTILSKDEKKMEVLPHWAEHPDLITFYTQHRNRPEDLYPSERRFLPWLAKQSSSVLDVGCAAGGFRNIWRHYQPAIKYTGVDVSASLIDAARRLYPDSTFQQGNCAAGLSLSNRYATVVQALGWLHWEPEYQRALAELWRLTDRYLFFDVRLVADRRQETSGSQQMALSGSWDGTTTTPYICVAWPRFAALMMELGPAAILGYGYWGKPAKSVMGIDHNVCFATFVLEKASAGKNASRPVVCIDMPLPWLPALAVRAEVRPPAELEALVPSEKE